MTTIKINESKNADTSCLFWEGFRKLLEVEQSFDRYCKDPFMYVDLVFI